MDRFVVRQNEANREENILMYVIGHSVALWFYVFKKNLTNRRKTQQLIIV